MLGYEFHALGILIALLRSEPVVETIAERLDGEGR